MALRIVKSSDPIVVEQLVACIYGSPGIGKTSLGFSADAPLLLDFDHGAYRSVHRGDSVQVDAWSDVAGLTGADLKDYKTLVVDTAGRALDSLSVDITDADPKFGRAGSLTLKGFGELKSRFIGWLKYVRSFKLDVVLICHVDEQRRGDDLIERLDAQGSSKGEIYKCADVMGRIAMVRGQRTLNLSPTDTAFGKNPAQLPALIVPEWTEGSDALAQVLTRTREALNRQSAEQQAAAEALGAWREKVEKAATLEDFNELLSHGKDMNTAVRENAKRALVAAAKSRGFTFDKAAKVFAQPKAA